MYLFREGRATAIVGGQFGSEAKGLAANMIWGQFGFSYDPEKFIHTTNAGAQAGHTCVLERGDKFVCFHLPTAGVLNPYGEIYINAGAIIDIEVLRREVQEVAAITGENPLHLAGRIVVNPYAAVISVADMVSEHQLDASTTKIGSTQKGVGKALTNKIMRKPGSVAKDHAPVFHDMGILVGVRSLPRALEYGKIALIEVPQGTGLSIHGGSFPYCTSRECWAGQGMVDAGLHPHYLHATALVVRTHPIRVGHIYDAEGEKVGDSGPWAWGSVELDWERDFPGIEPERTTVTKRVRRIATWSRYQYAQALQMNRPSLVILTFCNYMKDAGALKELALDMDKIEGDVGQTPRRVYSWGPKASQSGDLSRALEMSWF